jgi:predicted dehydrogenase
MPITTHAHAISADKRFTLAAIVGPDRVEAEALAQNWGVESVFDDLDAFLVESECDLITIASPDDTHADIVCRILASPRPPALIVVEKPVCTREADLERISKAIAQAPSSRVVVNQSLRFSPPFQAVKDILSSGDLGPLLQARWVYYGGWIHNGIHMLDIQSHIFGGAVQLAESEIGHQGPANDPCLDVTLLSEAYPEAKIFIESFPEDAYQICEGDIRCRDGRVRMLDFCSEIHIDRPIQNDIDEVELKLAMPMDIPTDKSPMQSLYDCCGYYLVHGDETAIKRVTFDSVVPAMRLLFAAVRLANRDTT